MSAPKINSYEEFWPYYVRAHSHPTNRMLHFAGTTVAMTLLAAAVYTRRPRLLALAPLVGYGAAWIGHFGIEKNVPATFGHPLWSLASDFVMWWKIANGTMDAEVERYTQAPQEEVPATKKAAEPVQAAQASPDPRTLN